MIFASLIAALLLEQARPLRPGNRVHSSFRRWTGRLERDLSGGQYQHGVVAWLLAVLPVVAIVVAIQLLLGRVSPLLAWLWNVAVLYLTMGFRRFSHHFTDIMHALRGGDLAAGREHLGQWRGDSAAEFDANETARVAIELGLADSHRHVFGTIAWFVALGPAGAATYRLAAVLNGYWGARRDSETGEFGRFAADCFLWLDWIPVRLTAASFAVVGNFEDAIYCWRTQAHSWESLPEGILLASGAGALGVRLGGTLHGHGSVQFRPELGTGESADVDYMDSTVGLIWRVLVLWMFLIALASAAYALG